MGIDAILKLIAALAVLAKAERAVMKDGKIDLSDLAVLSDLAAQHQVIWDAVTAAKDLPAEVKDLNFAEAAQIVQAVMDAVKDVKASV